MANPTTIAPGQSSTLTWTTQNGTSASISGIGTVPLNGSVPVSPAQTTTYTLTVTGANGTTATKSVTVTVSGGGPGGTGPVISSLSPSPCYSANRLTHLSVSATDPNNLALAYLWTTLDNQVAIVRADTATPEIQFPVTAGDYVFTVTVTNSAGQSTSASLTCRFTGTNNSLQGRRAGRR
jgi:hypothetical protein